MPRLPSSVLFRMFQIQQQLAETIDLVSSTEFVLFHMLGDMDDVEMVMTQELELLRQTIDRLQIPSTQLHRLIFQLAESQTLSTPEVLADVDAVLTQTEALLSAVYANVKEMQRKWNLP